MVRQELNLRERGIGYSKFAANIKNLAQRAAVGETVEQAGRYDQILASLGIQVVTNGTEGTITYGGPRSDLAEAFSTPEATAALGEALDEKREDMEVYISRKLSEAAEEAGFES
jgi:hypothetical protein